MRSAIQSSHADKPKQTGSNFRARARIAYAGIKEGSKADSAFNDCALPLKVRQPSSRGLHIYLSVAARWGQQICRMGCSLKASVTVSKAVCICIWCIPQYTHMQNRVCLLTMCAIPQVSQQGIAGSNSCRRIWLNLTFFYFFVCQPTICMMCWQLPRLKKLDHRALPGILNMDWGCLPYFIGLIMCVIIHSLRKNRRLFMPSAS